MLRIVRGRRPATPFQRSFARAGHAHAGVLVVLALVGQILADAAALAGVDDFLARTGIWVAAVLFPAGFFLSSAGRDRAEPNGLIVLLYAGAVSLTVGVVATGDRTGHRVAEPQPRRLQRGAVPPAPSRSCRSGNGCS
jgi:hypothetical protein